MKKNYFVCTVVLLALVFFAALATADDDRDLLVRFKGGIGVNPVSSAVGTAATATTVNRNIVRNIQPPGQIWVIRDLDARIKTNGDIKVDGRGLTLGGGNSIGRTTGQIVFATLICEAAAPFTERSTAAAGVPLAPNGDFAIDDVLVPLPPATCASPMLLIRTAGSGNWFAAGIPVTQSNSAHGDD
jgi:hypothetical protein